MNREIKFRAWVVNNSIKEMQYADEIQINSADAKAFQLRVGFEDAFPEKNNIEQWQKDIVWMQFTGIRDMVGKEVYESDKVIYTLNHDSSQKEIEAVVEWHNHAWRLNRIWLLTEIRNIKVVGNVHEAVSQGCR
jgi:uncharacterized phage protein (TIGR01671 family)